MVKMEIVTKVMKVMWILDGALTVIFAQQIEPSQRAAFHGRVQSATESVDSVSYQKHHHHHNRDYHRPWYHSDMVIAAWR